MPMFEVWVAPIEDPTSTILNRIQAKDPSHVQEIVEQLAPCLQVVAVIEEPK